MKRINIQLFAENKLIIPEECEAASILVSPLDGNITIIAEARKVFKVDYNLTNCFSSTLVNYILDRKSFSATITAFEGYDISNAVVEILMGNLNITPIVYSNGNIFIESVTDNLTINIKL